jgi:hypothetical protein
VLVGVTKDKAGSIDSSETASNGKSIGTGNGTRSPSSAKDWEGETITTCGDEKVQSLTWGPGESIFAATTTATTTVFSRAVLHRKLRQDVAAVQVSAKRVLVRRGASIQLDLFVGIRIKGEEGHGP